MQTALDMTPTWAALMPAFIAVLQNGKGDGPRIAAEELTRLAASVDAMNARARASGEATADSPRPSETALAEGRAQGREQAALDLARAAEDFATAGQIRKAAAYLEAACRIAPARLELTPSWQAQADSWARDMAQDKGEATRACDSLSGKGRAALPVMAGENIRAVPGQGPKAEGLCLSDGAELLERALVVAQVAAFSRILQAL